MPPQPPYNGYGQPPIPPEGPRQTGSKKLPIIAGVAAGVVGLFTVIGSAGGSDGTAVADSAPATSTSAAATSTDQAQVDYDSGHGAGAGDAAGGAAKADTSARSQDYQRGYADGYAEQSGEQAATPNETEKPSPAPATPKPDVKKPVVKKLANPMPSKEKAFVKIVEKGIDQGDAADNDLKMGRAMKKRDKAVCSLHASTVHNWVGTVTTLDSNGDGNGILSVQLQGDIAVGTWNNAFSDAGDNTLIKSDKLMDRLADMDEGQTVKFSGTFIRSPDGGCTYPKGLTKIGKLLEPEYVF
jgi:hypothetical protein